MCVSKIENYYGKIFQDPSKDENTRTHTPKRRKIKKIDPLCILLHRLQKLLVMALGVTPQIYQN
jgi:hypothetical protein